jgi:hypothetical protein
VAVQVTGRPTGFSEVRGLGPFRDWTLGSSTLVSAPQVLGDCGALSYRSPDLRLRLAQRPFVGITAALLQPRRTALENALGYKNFKI